MIYLDNGATSFPKPENVYMEMDRCSRKFCANPGRGGHAMSIEAGVAVLEARKTIGDFFNIRDYKQIAFTKNATEALNHAINGILKPGDHVVTTSMEHNSVIRPLKTLERDIGVQITIVKGNEYGEIDPDQIKKALKSNTKLIVTTFSSNVNGIIMPIDEIGEIARNHGIPLLVDASQGAGSIEIDVLKSKIDMLAFPGHKSLLGPQGTGGLYLNENIKLRPLYQGGTGSDSENLYQPENMPDLLESGTLNTPGIVGLAAGIEYINQYGLAKMRQYKYNLVNNLHNALSEIKKVKLYSKNNINQNSGIVAFNFIDIDSGEVSYVLDKIYNIASRSGLHCSPMAHETLRTKKTGIVRLSVSSFNTAEEIQLVKQALIEISEA